MNSDVGPRLGELVKALGMKKVRFAEQVGVDKSYVTQLTKGIRQPSDLLVTSICREFNVNETWLRTGEGEMFKPESAFDLGEYVKRHGMTALETEILKAYLELDPAMRGKLLQHFKDRLAKSAAPPTDKGMDGPATDTAGQERTEVNIAAKVAELEEQNRELKAQNLELKAELAEYYDFGERAKKLAISHAISEEKQESSASSASGSGAG